MCYSVQNNSKSAQKWFLESETAQNFTKDCILQNQEQNYNCNPISAASSIRDKKSDMQKRVRKSLVIPKKILNFNGKDEKRTASSLRDLNINDKFTDQDKNKPEKQVLSSGSTLHSITSSQSQIMENFEQLYQISKKIGQGAHSLVYECLQKESNQKYILKKIKNIKQQLLQKHKIVYEVVKGLNHECVINYKKFFYDEEKYTVFIIMENQNMNDLRAEINKRIQQNNKFSIQQIQNICRQIIELLKYLSEEGICHRDLKPQNILYSPSTGRIKVIDFDVCGIKQSKDSQFSMWTQTGSLFYRAPESFKPNYNEKCDIWSLGIILYELLFLRLPFNSEYRNDHIDFIQQKEMKLYIKKELKEIECQNTRCLLESCLEKQPTSRCSAIELLKIMDRSKKQEC